MFESTRREVRSMIDEFFAAHKISCHRPMEPVKRYICETCGCLIAPEFAVAGEKEIRQKDGFEQHATRIGIWGYRIENPITDYIHTPYYCKTHAPKGKK